MKVILKKMMIIDKMDISGNQNVLKKSGVEWKKTSNNSTADVEINKSKNPDFLSLS